MTDRTSDGGLSLVELIIVVLLIGILGTVMATILANSWAAQNDVTTTTQATNRGQLIGQTIERALRNAQAIDVSVDGTPSADGTGNLLRVHTTQSGAKACQAFWFTGGSIYMTQSSGVLPNAVVSSWPNAWTDKVVRHAGTPYFAMTGATVTYTFDITTNAAPVSFAGRASMRAVSTGVTSPCW